MKGFGRYVLDVAAGRLMSDGREIPLRPSTFSLLRYLAERPGQRVSRAELIAALWPDQADAEEQFLQGIGELRGALGDVEGRLIRYTPEEGALLDPAAAAPERRRARGLWPLRFRWMYGLIAPLVLAIVFALIWLVTSRNPPAPKAMLSPSVAILPFQNQSDDAAQATRADEFTRQLIADFARKSTFKVKSWDEVAVYKGVLAQPGQIARVLSVRYQVEGSLRVANDQLRVSAQLVDLQGRVLWSVRHVESADNAALVRERLVDGIVSALDQSLTSASADAL